MTRITLCIADPDGSSSWQLELQESFDDVMDKIYPVQTPSSTLGHRANLVYTKTDGNRVCIQPGNVIAVEEVQ